MQLAPFLLDEWLAQKFSADPPIEFDLGSSTGPSGRSANCWRSRAAIRARACSTRALSYTSPRGLDGTARGDRADAAASSRTTIQIVTGAAEALLALFYLAAEPGANVILPDPGFPANTALADSLGIEVRRYHLRAENGFAIDPDEIRGLATATRDSSW